MIRARTSTASAFSGGCVQVILTVTLNTALDITYRVPRADPARQPPRQRGHRTPRRQGPQRRPRAGRARPRERGHRLRGRRRPEPCCAICSPPPRAPRDALVPVAGTTRRTIAVVDDASGDTTQLNEPGPHVTADEWAAFLASYDDLLRRRRRRRPVRQPAARHPCGRVRRTGPHGPRAPASPSSWTPAANRCAAASPPAPTSSSRTPTSSPQLTGSREPLRATRDARRRGAHTRRRLARPGRPARRHPGRRLAGDPAGRR